MKARLEFDYKIDENHTLLAGAEVEITNGWCGCDGYHYNCILPDNEQMYAGGNDYAGTQHVINDNLLEIIDHTPYIDWEQRRYEISKNILSAFMSNSNPWVFSDTIEEQTDLAVRYADGLIKRLREKR